MKVLNSIYLLVIPIALIIFLNFKGTTLIKRNFRIKILSMLFLLMPFAQNTYSQWTSQTSGVTSYLSSIYFIDQSTGWSAGDNGKILKTTNGGANWVQLVSGVSDNFVSIQFVDAFTGWVSGNNSGNILKTTNGGSNWSSLSTGASSSVTIFFANASTGYAAAPGGVILKTTNGGNNWSSQISGITEYLTDIYFTDSNTGWVCSINGLILATTNGGINWSQQYSSAGFEFFSVFFTNSLTGWAAGGGGNVCRTTNGGVNWTLQTTPTDEDLLSVFFPNSSTGWISCSNGKMLVTSNGGANWSFQGVLTITFSLNSVFFIGTSGWACGGNGTIVSTSNSGGLGLPWTAQNPGASATYNAICAVSSTLGWVAGSNGTVRRTENGGNSWENVSGAPTGTSGLNAIFAFDQNICLTADGSKIFRTSNGGENWTQVHTQAAGFINDIGFKDANTGFMNGDPSGGRWTLWKTTNGGINWDSTGLYLPQNGTETGKARSMCVSGNNIWFGTNNFRIYYSTNFGSSWSYSVTPCRNTRCISFIGSTGFFGGDSVMMKSTNGGINWTGNYLLAPGAGISSVSNAGGKWWAAKGDTIFVSTDGGNTFQFQYKGGASYYDMSFVVVGSSIRGWGVKGTGGIDTYFETLTGTTHTTVNVPEGYILSQNYPNPFNPSTQIKFMLPKQSLVKITVYDITGREVETLVDAVRNAGTHNVNWNASEFSSGVYFYRIEAGDYTDTKKMILLK